jgi:hypothetical protein
MVTIEEIYFEEVVNLFVVKKCQIECRWRLTCGEHYYV